MVVASEKESFLEKSAYLAEDYDRAEASFFYRFLFPEGSFERQGHPEDKRGNGIILSIDAERGKARKTILTDGLEQLSEALEEPFVVCSPISYYGRSRRADHALYLHALTLDIDYVDIRDLKTIVSWAERLHDIPIPTFIVNSGHGVHLYYVFDNPIPMYRNNQAELRKLKTKLIDMTWTKFTSRQPERKEALGVVQGFRMVGSPTKIEGCNLEAFKTGGRVSVEYLNSFVLEGKNRASIKDTASLFSLDQAKEEWPEWYEKRIVKGEVAGRWYVKRDLYDWYKAKAAEGGTVGHRYFCMMCLGVYAMKCGIPFEELEKDALELQKVFHDRGKDREEAFTVEETYKALEAFNESYTTFPRESVERITAIPMPANKRNYRKRALHLKLARATLEILNEDAGKNLQGRPKGSGTKERLIKGYAAAHPEANHSEISRALGVDRKTVIKWLKEGM